MQHLRSLLKSSHFYQLLNQFNSLNEVTENNRQQSQIRSREEKIFHFSGSKSGEKRKLLPLLKLSQNKKNRKIYEIQLVTNQRVFGL